MKSFFCWKVHIIIFCRTITRHKTVQVNHKKRTEQDFVGRTLTSALKMRRPWKNTSFDVMCTCTLVKAQSSLHCLPSRKPPPSTSNDIIIMLVFPLSGFCSSVHQHIVTIFKKGDTTLAWTDFKWPSAFLCVKNDSKEVKSSLGSLLKIVMNFRENAQGAKYCEDAKKGQGAVALWRKKCRQRVSSSSFPHSGDSLLEFVSSLLFFLFLFLFFGSCHLSIL